MDRCARTASGARPTRDGAGRGGAGTAWRLLAVGALAVAGACGSSESSGTSDATASVAASTTTVPAGAAATTTTTTTATAATTTTMAGTAGVIEPEVVCVDLDDGSGGDVAFAYVNTGEVGLVVSPGDSTVTNGEEADLALVPVVFAAGRNSPAFWVTPVDPDLPVSWTVIGPDGIERTATADGDAPACTPELEEPEPADPRLPGLSIVDAALADDGSLAVVTLELIGVPELSVCGAGLEPRPVSIEFTVTSRVAGELVTVTAAGPRVEFVVEATVDPVLASNAVSVLVLDRCELGGAVQTSWPAGLFHEVYGAEVCVLVDGEVNAYLYGEEGSCGLPRAGGARVRPA